MPLPDTWALDHGFELEAFEITLPTLEDVYLQVRIKPEAIPEYWLQRQREMAEAAASESGEPALVGITREEAERMLGGNAATED